MKGAEDQTLLRGCACRPRRGPGGAGRPQRRLAHFRAAVEIAPNNAIAHNNLGSILAMSGNFDEAVVHFRKALEINPDYADARRNLNAALAKRPPKQ